MKKIPNSQFHKGKNHAPKCPSIFWHANIDVIYTMNIFHNIISHVTKWNSNTNPMKKFIFHAIIIHKFTEFLRSQNWKTKPPGSQACKITHHTNALRHLHHILVHHARISTPRERRRKHLLLIFTWWWWWW